MLSIRASRHLSIAVVSRDKGGLMMTQAKSYLVIALLGLAVLASYAALAQESEPDVSSGKALYDSFQCWQCHGYEGQGSRAGPRIARTHYPYIAFATLVRHTNLMPAYSPNVLSDAQLRDIYAFVRAIPEPPALEDISILDSE
jgi:mono/diheme cytochrome c family protein